MEQPGRSTFPGFPEQCRLGHPWKPGTVVIDWRPCECRTASAARGGHLEVGCGTPGCSERWQRPRHEPPRDPGPPPARTLSRATEGVTPALTLNTATALGVLAHVRGCERKISVARERRCHTVGAVAVLAITAWVISQPQDADCDPADHDAPGDPCGTQASP